MFPFLTAVFALCLKRLNDQLRSLELLFGYYKISIGIDTSAAIFGIMRFNETKELKFEIVGVTQKQKHRNRGAFVFDFLFWILCQRRLSERSEE